MQSSFPQSSGSSEPKVTLEITVENSSPENGAVITPVWFGLHDGSFDTFEVGETASSGLMFLAEEGFTGLEGTVPGVVETLVELGLDPAVVPAQENTIGGEFASSEAAQNGGTQGLVANAENPLGIAPGDSLSATVEIDRANLGNNRYFNFAAMFFPSNDGFFGNDDAIELFDEYGNFVAEDIILTRDHIWDAGTEVNDESPNSIPFTFNEIGNGIEENGTVQSHPGLLPAGSGGVLDFNASDDPIGRISITPVINGTGQSDVLYGTDGREKIRGFRGDDLIISGDGNDTVEAGVGDDNVFGNRGDDYLLGNGGNDLLTAGAGNDVVEGGSGRDHILGNGGNDYLSGNSGQDFILGGNGDDLIDGGRGNDRIWGNSGADQFVLRAGNGRDTIFDYQDNVDSFVLADDLVFEDLTITQGTGQAIISITDTQENLAVLVDVNAGDITAEDFTTLV